VWQRAQELRAAIAGIAWATIAPGLVVSVTVGVAVSPPADGDDGSPTEPLEIYRAADRALYAAKRDGSGIVLTEVAGSAPA
jgi:two-component system cell cycle response regulator